MIGIVSAVWLFWLALYSADRLALYSAGYLVGLALLVQSCWSGWHCIVQPVWQC